MKEYNVGEVFEYEGVKLRVEECSSCSGCYFETKSDCEDICCAGIEREDNKSTIYREVKDVKEIKNEDALFWVNRNDVEITLKEGYTEEALKILRDIHPNAKFKNHLGDEIICIK